MTENGITLSGKQVQAIHRALTALERELKSMPHTDGWQRPYVMLNNLQAIRTALTANLLRGNN
jgi:hypothetical protein